MADSDDSYDFSQLDDFLDRLRAGDHLVMGNRFRGGIAAGAMPALHRYFGNPILSAIGRLLFRCGCSDLHCGLRGFLRAAILALDLRTPGMEFASEMVVKAALANLRVSEVSTTLSPDGRGRPSHLRSWRDGWRHLRFMLLFSPRWLFFYPGTVMLLLGLAGMAWLLPGPRAIGGVVFDVHTLLYCSLLVVVGFQSLLFWLFAKCYAMYQGVLPIKPWFCRLMSVASLELGLAVSGGLVLVGFVLALVAFGSWGSADLGPLSPTETMRLVIPSTTSIMLGFELAYGMCFVSVLEIRAARFAESPVARAKTARMQSELAGQVRSSSA